MAAALAQVTAMPSPCPRGSTIHSTGRSPATSSTIGRPAAPGLLHTRMARPLGKVAPGPGTQALLGQTETGGALGGSDASGAARALEALVSGGLLLLPDCAE